MDIKDLKVVDLHFSKPIMDQLLIIVYAIPFCFSNAKPLIV